MKNRAVVVFTDAALHRELKVRCVADGQTMTAVVEALVKGWLKAEAAVEEVQPRKKRAVTSPLPRTLTVGDPIDSEALKGLSAAPLPGATTLLGQPICRRCGHEQAAHWIKGCLAGCLCSDQRFAAA